MRSSEVGFPPAPSFETIEPSGRITCTCVKPVVPLAVALIVRSPWSATSRSKPSQMFGRQVRTMSSELTMSTA